MLGRSNFLAIVGGGQAPKFPDRNGMLLHVRVDLLSCIKNNTTSRTSQLFMECRLCQNS